MDHGPEFAVLIPIIERGGQECILLTKRLDSLPEYSGHVSFPGGARDPGDSDLAATAIRETREEVGISPERISVVGEMDWHSTTLGHRVKPFVARIAPGPVRPNPLEVDRILYLPLAILERDPFRLRTWRDESGKARSTYTFQFEGLEIWGLTARILRRCFVKKARAE
jgi:8-oxo-dGTP pyrophosphatase MutT (NUDIX family)